jgi:hypothetical protein
MELNRPARHVAFAHQRLDARETRGLVTVTVTEKPRIQKKKIAIILDTAIVQRAVVSYIHLSLLSEILLLSVAKRRGQDFFFACGS